MNHNESLIAPTHPWIDFKFDVRRLDFKTWMALGECVSKCEHVAKTPLTPQVSEELHLIYLSKGVQATTAIEGNTLTEQQVKEAVLDRLEVPPSKEYLAQEVRNIIDAVNSITAQVQKGEPPEMTPAALCEYNRMVLKNLAVTDGVLVGKFRQHNVTVGHYRAPAPQYVPRLVNRLCEKLNTFERSEHVLSPIAIAILKAIFAHLYVAWIHPFGDGNGRTARLLEFDILLRSGIPSPAVHLLSNHYNATRTEYYRQLDVASRQRNAYSFISYAVTGFRDGLVEQLEAINEHVRNVVWVNFVHEQFHGEKGEVARRRRDVVLAISQQAKPVTLQEVPVLSNTLKEHYRKKTSITVRRDLNTLHFTKKLLIQSDDPKGYVANRGLVDAFLPLRQRGKPPS